MRSGGRVDCRSGQRLCVSIPILPVGCHKFLMPGRRICLWSFWTMATIRMGHTSVTDNAGVSVQTTFDIRGRSDHFIWSGGGISPASVNLDRNGRGQVTAIDRHSNATLSSLVSRTTYDQIAPQGWVKQIQHRQANGQLYNAGTNFTYGYDAEGEVMSQSSQGNSTTYGYDPTGQLLRPRIPIRHTR